MRFDKPQKRALALFLVAGQLAIARLNDHVIVAWYSLQDRIGALWTHHGQDAGPAMREAVKSEQFRR